MKRHLVFVTICFLLLITSCNDSKNNEDIKLGASCSVAGMESCSTDSSEILVCKDSLWRTKKSCNINFGEYCRQNPNGSYSCKESNTNNGNDTDQDESNSLPDNTNYEDNETDSTNDLENPTYGDSFLNDLDNDFNNISDDFEDIDNDSNNSSDDSVPDNNNSTDDDNISPDNTHEIGETRSANCTGLPANASWNDVSSILQTWNGSEWVPSTAGTYNLIASTSECIYKCDSGYFWNNFACVSPCDNNPCLHVTNSTGECTAISSSDYFCKCNTNYHWWGIEESCTNKLTLGNICTNQKKCYDDSAEMSICPAIGENFYGQDAQYAAQGTCTPQSFTVQTISSKNVVLDNNTGLMWQQTVPSEAYSWENAVNYCNNLTYAGYSDWRLPTPKEFLTIFDNNSYNLAVDETYFPNTHSSTTDTAGYWSTTIATDISTLAWGTSFEYGTVFSSTTPTNKKGLVRCVRGNNLPNSIFVTSTINNETILTDISTGLIWQSHWVTDKTWEEALDYCEKLTYGGYSDWRLPDKNELASLINYDKSDPASDFPDLPHNTNSTSAFFFLSSSSYNAQPEGAVCVDFNFGVIYGCIKSLTTLRVRCVR